VNSCERCDADGDGVLPGADGTRGPWQRTLADNGCIGRALVPVSRGRAGGAARGATDSVACATILLVCLCAAHSVVPRCRAPPARAARRSNRLLCVLTVYLPTRAGCCLVATVRRCKGGDGRGERGRCGRLFEVTEIARTDDKMLMDEMLNNTA